MIGHSLVAGGFWKFSRILLEASSTMSQPTTSVPSPPATRPGAAPWWRPHAVVLAVLGVCLLWAYWPSLLEMGQRWWSDPHYSHGWLVPAFSGWLLWSRRERIKDGLGAGSVWGLALIVLGVAIRMTGVFINLEWINAVSILPVVAGIAILIGGWTAWKWAWPAILFLFFMIPLPYRAEVILGGRLRDLATAASTYALQTLGLPAVAQGHTVLLGKERIAVADACNGLGMMILFTAFSVGAAIVVNRPLYERILIILMAVPNAIIGNVTRITVTGLLKETIGGKNADVFYHDMAGWLMMPLALLLLWAEMQIFARLFVTEVVEAGPRRMTLDQFGGGPLGPPRKDRGGPQERPMGQPA